ncbi:MAG: hypothetical protein HDQ97_12015 [Lachnospiraceae bacterium]|nr:hypothetical protein [Lachnospiraceae bacterium]
MKDFFSWVSNHKKIAILICGLLIVGVPIIIHFLFSINASNDFFVAKWSAGDMLQYYVAILGLFPTTLLSIAALRFTMYAKEDDDKKKGKVCISLENESYIKISWGKGLKYLEVPFSSYGDAIPEYVAVEMLDMHSIGGVLENVKIEGPRNLMGSIENIGEKRFKFKLTINDVDSINFTSGIVKIYEDYCRGLLTKEEFVSNTDVLMNLKLGIYCGGIVTPVRLGMYLKWDFEYIQSNEIGYRLVENSIHISLPVLENDYENQWK